MGELRVIAFFVGILFLSSQAHAICVFGIGSDCPPSDNAAQAALAQEVAWMLNEKTKVSCNIDQLRKINGIPEPFSGAYEYQFQATIRCTPAWIDVQVRDSLQGIIFSAFGGYKPPLDFNRTATFSGTLVFRKTDNGWVFMRTGM